MGKRKGANEPLRVKSMKVKASVYSKQKVVDNTIMNLQKFENGGRSAPLIRAPPRCDRERDANSIPEVGIFLLQLGIPVVSDGPDLSWPLVARDVHLIDDTLKCGTVR
jgi:hypothetical protein